MSQSTESGQGPHEEINPQAVSEADIAVVITSHKNADNIALTVRKAAGGLARYFPEYSSVIINCDNNSPDGTKEAFFAAEAATPRIYLSTAPTVAGRGASLAMAFEKAAALKAKAVAVVAADVASIRTRWIKSLLGPILEGGAEFVAPLYARHKYDSPISKGLAYPLARALFGRRVLQPISIDLAFSGRLNEIYRQETWPVEDRGYYMDIHMLYLAIVNQAPVCQSYMAHPRVMASGQPEYVLSASFLDVVENYFNLMLKAEDFWKKVTRSRPTSLAGIEEGQANLPPQVEVDGDLLKNQFLRYAEKTRAMWPDVFGPELTARLEDELRACAGGQCPEVDIELWRPAVYNAALAYKKAGPEDRRAVASCLIPLFFAKGLDSYMKGRDLDDRQFHALLEDEARAFEAAKKDFIARWEQ